MSLRKGSKAERILEAIPDDGWVFAIMYTSAFISGVLFSGLIGVRVMKIITRTDALFPSSSAKSLPIGSTSTQTSDVSRLRS